MEHSSTVSRAGHTGAGRDEGMLIRAAQADPAAFGVLYQRYLGPVYWYLRARTNSTEDADDLTQQVFLQALAALPRYRERGVPFAAWLFRIARNVATTFRYRQRRTVSWQAVPYVRTPCADQDPEAQALRHETLGQLGDLLAALDPEKRELLTLRFAAELTAREIAAVVGKSEAAVKKQLARTLQALKEQYHDA